MLSVTANGKLSVRSLLTSPYCGSKSAIQPIVTESGGRNHAIHNEYSMKAKAGMRTRTSSHEISQATTIPTNVRVDNKKLYSRALTVCGAAKACRQPPIPHENYCPNCDVLKLFRTKNPNGTKVTNPTAKSSARPAKSRTDGAECLNRKNAIIESALATDQLSHLFGQL